VLLLTATPAITDEDGFFELLQLLDPDLVQRLRTALTDNGLDPISMTLEINEGALLQNVEEARHRLRELKSLGVRLAIDDFGTGSSSLGVLREFPIDELKIDRTFVRGMVEDPAEGATLVRAILSLAQALHLEVVAEGIELPEQLDGLRESGCESGQGFLFATPVVADEIGFLLRTVERGRGRRVALERAQHRPLHSSPSAGLRAGSCPAQIGYRSDVPDTRRHARWA
jgi:EAL domain-containing protein (putative c-di-GMP-specific phosphodiesterase class I)